MAKKYTIEIPNEISEDVYDAFVWYIKPPDGTNEEAWFMERVQAFIQMIYESYSIQTGESNIDTTADQTKDVLEVSVKAKSKDIKVKI